MALKPAEQLYWDRYLAGLPAENRPKDAFVTAEFAGGKGSTDFLIDLYLKDRKSAGSSLVRDFITEGDPLPKVGNYWIVLDSKGEPRLLLKTLRTEKNRFKDVSLDIARAEGEGDLSLEHWRKVHGRAWGSSLERWGIPDIEEAEVITEYFEVLQSDVIRQPTEDEMHTVYEMGYDVWNGGDDMETYLRWCRTSPKYRSGRWQVLEDRDGFLSSSALLHTFADGAGIGSIATEPVRRRKGSASSLIRGVLCDMDRAGIERVYLYSDIKPEFYEKFGFRRLPESFQRKAGSVCMLRTRDFDPAISGPDFNPPPYF